MDFLIMTGDSKHFGGEASTSRMVKTEVIDRHAYR